MRTGVGGVSLIGLTSLALCACPKPGGPAVPKPSVEAAPARSTAPAPLDPLRLIPADALAIARLDTGPLLNHPALAANGQILAAADRFRNNVGVDPALLSDALVFYAPRRPRAPVGWQASGAAWRAALIAGGDFAGSPGIADAAEREEYQGHELARVGRVARLGRVQGALVLGDPITVRMALDAYDERAPAMSPHNRAARMLRAPFEGVFRFVVYWPVLASLDRSFPPNLARVVSVSVGLAPREVELEVHIDTADAAACEAWVRTTLAKLASSRDLLWRMLGPLLTRTKTTRETEAVRVRWSLPFGPVLGVLPILLRAAGL